MTYFITFRLNLVIFLQVDVRATENDVGDLLSVAGTVVTVQINRNLQKAIVGKSLKLTLLVLISCMP